MRHLLTKATTTEVDTELGTFTARVSGWSTDRGGDTIDPSAFDQSLIDWQESGKSLPLLYEHSDVAIGSLDPHSAVTDEKGLVIDGEVDRDTRQGKQVWKQIRRGSVGFSIGFMTTKSEDLEGGGKRLMVVDLLEISATSVPMHPGTGVIDWKSAAAPEVGAELSDEELRARSLELAAEALAPEPPPEAAPLPSREELDEERNAIVQRSRAEYKAARAAERAAREEKEEMRRRMHDFPKPPTRIVFNGSQYVEVDGRDPDDVSPGISPSGVLLPSANELKTRQQRREAEQVALREEEEKEEKERREQQALREAERQSAEEEGFITVNGVKMSIDGRLIP